MVLSPKHPSLRTAATGLVLQALRLNGSLLAAGDALTADLKLTSARWQVRGASTLSPVPSQLPNLPGSWASLASRFSTW